MNLRGWCTAQSQCKTCTLQLATISLASVSIHYHTCAAVFLIAKIRGNIIVICMTLPKMKKCKGDREGQEFQTKWTIHILVEVNNILKCLYANWTWFCQRMKLKAPLWKKPPEVLILSLLYIVRSSAWSHRHLSLRSLLNSILTANWWCIAFPHKSRKYVNNERKSADTHQPQTLATKSWAYIIFFLLLEIALGLWNSYPLGNEALDSLSLHIADII